jgi:glycerophosphoryl diester phosphodiesterase
MCYHSVVFLFYGATMKDKLIVAHRGASAYAKDNSIDSFTKAIDMGADMIELDVRQTADSVLIAHHDATTGGRRISQTTYDELKRIDGDIATCKEVLKLARGKIKLDIELKEQGYEKEAINLALEYMSPDDFVVTSFKSGCLEAIKRYHTKIKIGPILGRHQIIKALLSRISAKFPAKRACDVGADYLVIDYRLASDKVLKSAKENGLNIMVWTIDDTGDMRRFLSNDAVCGIITNHPDIAVKLKTAKE